MEELELSQVTHFVTSGYRWTPNSMRTLINIALVIGIIILAALLAYQMATAAGWHWGRHP
jgi:hypothetical protein